MVSPLAPTCEELEDKHTVTEFTTKVAYETANFGMSIPSLLPETKPPQGLKFFSKPGSKDGPVPQDAPSGPQGFVTKYWYIILPMVLMSLFGGEAPQQEGGEQQGQQQQGGAQSAAAAKPAASAPQGSTARQRRGKRG